MQILDPEDDPEEEEEDGGAQDIDATRSAKSAVMKTSTRQVRAVHSNETRTICLSVCLYVVAAVVGGVFVLLFGSLVSRELGSTALHYCVEGGDITSLLLFLKRWVDCVRPTEQR